MANGDDGRYYFFVCQILSISIFNLIHFSIIWSHEWPSIVAITEYVGCVVQQFSSKRKIDLEIIKDLHVYIK
jgi:hypothetical protein